MAEPKCPYCGHEIEAPPGVPDPPYDDAKDHTRCADCKGSGRDPVTMIAGACPACDGSGWV